MKHVVNDVTNGVEENIQATIADINIGMSLPEAFYGLLRRDVEAMINGGAEQGRHFTHAGFAWSGEADLSVVDTYSSIGEHYMFGWEDIVQVAGKEFVDVNRGPSAMARLQTSCAEGIALFYMNMGTNQSDTADRDISIGILEEDLLNHVRALYLLFVDITTSIV